MNIGIDILGSIEFATDLQLHFDMGKVLSGDFSCKEDDHHIKSSVVPMKFSCGFDQIFPILYVFIDIILR